MACILNGSKNASEDTSSDIKLHEAEIPWKPSFKLKRSSEADHELSVEKKLKRNALSILNKITPEKFELLLKQLEKLDICDEEKSSVLISLIYDKAVREPMYSVTYVKMCRFLAPIKITITNFQAEDFHSLFLKKCRTEFENALLDQTKFTEKLDSLSKPHDQEKLDQELWEEQYKIKRKLLGNVKLLGELFNHHMLPESDMRHYIIALCDYETAVLLEALCLLLKTAGEELFKSKDMAAIDMIEKIFERFHNIVEMHLSSTRIRFMILDVIDLKENNWVSRRHEFIPKTIEEIHTEAKCEENIQEYSQNKKIPHTKSNYTDQVETKSKHLLGEFLENNNIDPICHYVGSLLPNRLIVFVTTFILQVLEENSQSRQSVGELMFHLVRKKLLKIDQYRDGFSNVVEKCKNLAVDTPLIWNNVGEIICPLAGNDPNNLAYLKILLEPHKSSNISEKILCGTFHCFALKEGSHKAQNVWDAFKDELNEMFTIQCNMNEVISAHEVSN